MTRRALNPSCLETRTGRADYFGFGDFRYAG